MDQVFYIHFLSCLFLTGLIWTVQLVHYPSFMYISDFSFQQFSSFHQKKISLIVGPLMALELVTGIILIAENNHYVLLINFLGILLTMAATILISMPLHRILTRRKAYPVIKKLVSTNWIRTFLWSGRSLLLFYFVLQKGL